MKKFYVYQLRLENSVHPFYIGKGHGRRIECHFQESSLRRRNHKNHTIKKAMAQGIKVMPEILHENLTEEQALSKEVELILLYGRRSEGGLLTNKALGGGGSFGYRHTDEAKKKNVNRTKRPETWRSREGEDFGGVSRETEEP